MKRSLLLWVFALSVAGCWRPGLQLKQEAGAAVLDFSILGEYPEAISRIRLSEAEGGRVIWEVKGGQIVPRLWDVRLVPGENQAQLEGFGGDRYQVVTPARGMAFRLQYGRRYRVEAWGETGKAKVSGLFSFVPP
jgi:hypothetical protein